LKPKRILLLDLGSVKGGVETYLERLAGILKGKAALDCICILPELARNLEAQGVRVILLPQFGAATKPLSFLITAILMPIVILRDKVDAVQVNGFLEAVYLPLVRLIGREAVYTRHGPFEIDLFPWYRNPRKFLPRFISKLCARFSSRIICVSEDVKTTVLDVIPEERAIVIQNWVSYVPAYKPRPPMLTGPARLLCVARIERYKGIHLVIEAMRTLPGVGLTVVGDGGYRKELERLAAGLNVRFEGYQANPAAYYETSDIFIMPSMGPEGSSMGALLVHDDALRASYSREGYETVRTRFNADVARDSYLAAFAVETAPRTASTAARG
jgi:glycosyltransferase involved in cell wall biosynthesis